MSNHRQMKARGLETNKQKYLCFKENKQKYPLGTEKRGFLSLFSWLCL